MTAFTESTVEQAALAWLEGCGWAVKHGPEIAPGKLAAEPGHNTGSVLQDLQHDALLPTLICEIRIKDAERIAGGLA